jgi:predicted NAD/FAD-binding protein
MLRDLARFYREAPHDAQQAGDQALDDYLDLRGYGRAFRDDHLYPMAAAIWSTSAAHVGRYPIAAFVRFCQTTGCCRSATGLSGGRSAAEAANTCGA